MGRYFPAAREKLADLARRLVERAVDDCGYYTNEYARDFAEALNADGGPTIEVRLFTWSGENHHLGRADAAVRLIDEWATLELAPGSRILAWAHSHAGNVLALLSNLVVADAAAQAAFFDAARPHFRIPWLGICDIPVWSRVETLLREGSRPIVKYPLDVVTFGTPLRYGWDLRGCERLLHFVHHRPLDPADPNRALPPRSLDDVQRAVGGDYVQQLGIAGTNLPPSPLMWRSWTADRRLNALLQPAELTVRNVWERMLAGRRVPDAGQTLLVDYGPAEGSIAEHFAGHAVYTRREWLPFHADVTAEYLYSG